MIWIWLFELTTTITLVTEAKDIEAREINKRFILIDPKSTHQLRGLQPKKAQTQKEKEIWREQSAKKVTNSNLIYFFFFLG